MTLIVHDFLPRPRKFYADSVRFEKSGFVSVTEAPVLTNHNSGCIPCVSEHMIPTGVLSALILSMVLLTLMAVVLISRLQTIGKFKRIGSITRSDTLVPVLITLVALPILVSLLYNQNTEAEMVPKSD